MDKTCRLYRILGWVRATGVTTCEGIKIVTPRAMYLVTGDRHRRFLWFADEEAHVF